MKKTRLLALLTVLALAVSLFAACGGAASSSAPASSAPAAASSEAAPSSSVAEASSAAPAEGAITVTDMLGREVSLDAPAEKVVALTAAECEILYAIGAGDTLVGRGAYCNYPEDVLALPEVDSGYETNVEQIIALAPQVVFMSSMNQDPEQISQMEAAGIQVIVSESTNIAGAYESIALVGTIVGKEKEAGELVASMMTAFDEIAANAPTEELPTVYFEISPLEYGLWTCGNGTFMAELAEMAGLTNVFSDLEGWAEVSQEQVIERNPDYIITTFLADSPEASVSEIEGRDGWSAISAVQNGNVYYADNDSFSRPGPRLVDAAKALVDIAAGTAQKAA